MRKYFLIFLAAISFYSGFSQQTIEETIPQNWMNQDSESDSLYGVSTEKAYKFLKKKKSVPIIVGVLDSGVDIDHEDLKGKIWTNPNEIAGNGKDDDGNGYIDDVHGWNFIGGANGNIKEDTHEMTREYVRLKNKYANIDKEDVPEDTLDDYNYWLKLEKDFDRIVSKSMQEYEFFNSLYVGVTSFDSTFKAKYKIEEITPEFLTSIDGEDSVTNMGVGLLNFVFSAYEYKKPLDGIISDLTDANKHYTEVMEYAYNTDFDPRGIVGDDYNNLWEQKYGNSHVSGPSADHGTHVAGIIGAKRNNGLGMDGIADNVLIMPVRVVPQGDERDKDIANGIRYAVDNGASIINMSFGKGYSPGKVAIDSAVKYAMDKGVLIIHAAGNENKNRDITKRYPIAEFDGGMGMANNWIEVGASARLADENLVGSFSNYGKNTVNFFAPGVRVYSTVPDNKYEYNDGTSMAAPVVSGVAALVWSYFPDLTYIELIEILNKSVVKPNVKVLKPGTENELVDFSELSVTGGIINAYKAVTLAQEYTKSKGKVRKR